ncbi:MAG: AAA family ATPase [Acidimicrobiales bacterium]
MEIELVDDEATPAAFDAVVGFVDLAGFTAATERLGRLGARGTEELGELINALFTPAIDIVHRVGGEVGWFAGDAIGVLFDRSTTPDGDAVEALLEVSRVIMGMTPVATAAGDLTMAVKIGAAAGPVRWCTVVGDQKLSWFAGEAIDRAADAEHFADPGDLVVHQTVLDAVAGQMTDTTVLAPEFALVASTSAPSLRAATVHPLVGRRSLDHQPPRVARLARSGDAGFLDQHRPVTSMFVRMPQPAHDRATLAGLQEILGAHGGYLSSATEGDKGAVALALFGVPTAVADRQRRALVAALEIRDLLPGASIGITSGRAYAGRVGSDARWDYSLVGDSVNTAARLMQAAGSSEILVDHPTLDGAGAGVVVVDQRSLVLKGKAEPEPTAVVGEVSATEFDGADRGAFVGRDAEAGVLLEVLARSGMAVVVADAGAGKSRLLHHVVSESTTHPLILPMEPGDRSRPFALWRQLLPAVVGVEPSEVLAALEQTFGADPRVPLAGFLLGRSVALDSSFASLDADDRAEVLAGFLVEVLRSRPEQRPILIEDLHWVDDSSLDLLVRMVGRLPGANVTVLATSRPEPQIEELGDDAGVRMIALGPLGPGAMAELAAELWTDLLGSPPSAAVARDLVERSAGNPLFCEQLVSFAHAAGVAPDAPALPSEGALPVTLTDLLLARLDSLPEPAAVAASYAAVFGSSFTVDDLVGAFGGRPGSAQILGGVEILRDQGVVVGLGSHRFAHSLLGEAAYDRLSFGLRGELHLHVVERLEATGSDDVDALARHTASTNDTDRQRKYFRLAGDAAAAQYAHEVSRTWYTALLPLLDGAVFGEIELALGEVEFVAGALVDARDHLRSAVEHLPVEARVGAQATLARVLVGLGEPSEGFDVLEPLIADTEASGDWVGLRVVMETKADLATMLGDVARAEEVEALLDRLRRSLGGEHPAAAPLEFLVPLLWMRGEIEEAAIEYERQFDGFVEQGDLVNAGMNAADLAGLAFERRDLAATFDWMERARDLLERAGHARALVRFVRGNEIVVRLALGDTEGAREVAEERLYDAIELQDPNAVGETLALLSRLVPNGRVDLALRAIAVGSRVANNDLVADAFHALAVAHLDDGAPEVAVDLLGVVLGQFDGAAEVQVELAEAQLRIGGSEAKRAIERLSTLATEAGHLGALAAAALATATGVGRGEAIERCRIERDAFPSAALGRALRGLGIEVTPPALPPPSVVVRGDVAGVAAAVDFADREVAALHDWPTTARTVVDEALIITEGVD